MCFSMLVFNVSATGSEMELTPISGQIQAETVDISQLEGSIGTTPVDVNCDKIHFDIGEEEKSNKLSTDISDILSLVTEIEDENDDDTGSTIAPKASANPVSSLKITAVGVGNSENEILGNGDWKIIYSDSSGTSNLSKAIDATDCKYICFRIFQWGYTSSKYFRLDGEYSVHSNEVCTYDAFGNVAGVGDVIYGFLDEYIFEIPKNKTSSEGIFIGYYKNNGIKVEANANITWTTPTGPAPTTPVIEYDPSIDDAWIKGIDNTMEYRLKVDDGTNKPRYSNWFSFTDTEALAPIYDDMPYTLQIRYKTSTNNNPSLNKELQVKARSEAPNGYTEYFGIDEILVLHRCDKQLEVAFGDGTKYIPVTGNIYVSVADFIDKIQAGGFNRIYVRHRATSDEPASQSVIFKLYGRNPQIPNNVYYENGMLYNLTPNMIFRFNGDAWYSTQLSEVNITSFMSKTETTLLEIRYAPTDNMSCSSIYTITLPVLPA